jgi:hypothetical protein
MACTWGLSKRNETLPHLHEPQQHLLTPWENPL